MPEAQRDLDSSLVHSTINHINSTAYDRLPRHDPNSTWSSIDSIDVSYVPLVSGVRYEVNPSPTVKLSKPIQNVLATSEVKHFCCCSGEVREFGSCWKSKRRQIIWESAHASAKNRIATTATTARRRRITTTATPTLSESLLPTLITTTTTTTTTAPRTSSKTTPFQQANKSEVGVNKRKGGVNNNNNNNTISISLPATPNLSHLQRRQYKKLSLECEEFVTGLATLQPLQLQMSATQQLQSFALANSCQIRQAANNIITTTADLHKQPQSMLLAHELIAVPATTTVITTPSSAAAAVIKFTACHAQPIAKNNNNNYNSNRNNNNQYDSLAANASEISRTQTQAHNSATNMSAPAPMVKTTTTTTTTTTATSTSAVQKSSLAFCEHCCESVSTLSSNSNSNSNNNSNNKSSSDHQTESDRFYGEDVDSVSGELSSSFRLVSEEKIGNKSALSATPHKEQHKREREKLKESKGTHSPKHRGNVTEPQTAQKQASLVASTRSSSPAGTSKICCYTIGRASTHYGASDKPESIQSEDSSAVVPTAIAATAATPLCRVDTNADSNVDFSDFLDSVGVLSTSLPSNYGSATQCISSDSVKCKTASPPVPPPKPVQRDQCVVRANTNSRGSSQRALARLYYDPASFHRKLQKFETQTAKQSPVTGDPSARLHDLNDIERAECSSPEPCELLNCFGGAKNSQIRERVNANAVQQLVTRSSSDSSCCVNSVVSSDKCIVGNSTNNNNNNNYCVDPVNLSESVCDIDDRLASEANNNNYNCRILNAVAPNNRCQQPYFRSSPALNKRTLRYDSCGRLKLDRVFLSNKPFNASVVTQKSLSESRLPQSVASNKLTGNFHEVVASEVPTKCLSPTSPITPQSSLSPQSPLSPIETQELLPSLTELFENSSGSQLREPPTHKQLFKSFSDTHNFQLKKKLTEATSQQQQQHHHQSHTAQYQQQRSFSENPLKTSSVNVSSSSAGCKCAISSPNSSATTSPTSPTCISIQRKNSISLPNVPHSNGTQSPLWLSSETVASSRCDLQRGSDDTQSICSDQTTIFHLEHDCSTSSSPSSQSCGNHVVLRGPLLLKRIPEIQSFGSLPLYSQSLGNNSNAQEQLEKELTMEKRRNTLDRFQRLGFGRKSSPNSATATSQENNATKNRKPSEKSERLKELTELLRGNRSSPTPPPVPPPRKPRNGTQSASNSFEKNDKQTASLDDGKPLSFMSTQSDDIQLMDQEEQGLESSLDALVMKDRTIDPLIRCATHQHNTLKPNTSLSNFESLMLGRENSKSPPPIIQIESVLAVSSHIDPKLTRPESRTIIGSYTQKGIPFRSASFSQIDYSSGKYKKSALSLLRDRLRRDKAVDRSPSPTVANNNVTTLTRNKEQLETAAANGVVTAKKEPDWIYIPLKRTELSINLNYSSVHRSLEDVAESPDVLIEEDVFALDKESIAEKPFDPIQTQIAHAKMESLTDTIHSENDYTIDEEHLPVTVESSNLTETEAETAAINSIEVIQEVHVESNLATLIEEDMPLESPPDNFLQTATTCLIPVPVYECAAQDWRMENPPHEWVEVASEEFGIIPETIAPTPSSDQCTVAQPESKLDAEPKTAADILPIISVSHSSDETDIDADILRKKSQGEAADDNSILRPQDTVERRQASLDYPEVKKRYSQDDIEIGTEKRSSLDSIATRLSAEERKRIDKSRRRKGMYIESTDWSDGAAVANRSLALDITIANFNAIKGDAPEDCSNLIFLNSPMTDENQTPGSLYSLDLNTPESECSKPPVWAKSQGLSTFSCQSSEEKDDSQLISMESNDKVTVLANSPVEKPAVSLPRNHKSFPFLRTDSISDNESDRTPPPSRDRISASPSLSDNDFKRFSKRPLRGPYGQMLEAEMKKPNRMHFEEILEELRESEGISSQPRRQRNPYEGRSHEEPIGIGGISGGVTGTSGRNIPQYSSSVRVRKTSTFLPVPSHTRAASTPSQIENVTSSQAKNNNQNMNNSLEALNKTNPLEKRYQSTMDNNAVTCDRFDANGSDISQQQQQQQKKQEQQHQQQPHKVHIHTHTQQQQQQQPLHHHQHHVRDMKRASSEAPATKTHHSKRSQSMSGEKPTHHLHHHQQKRSLDVSSKQKNASNLMPTQELLAELLKGSSEKLLSEQRQQMFADTRTHVVQEIFKNEQSYVESLQTVVLKYLKVLKSPEHAGMIDSRTVDEIFFMVPDILEIHEKFLAELRSRLDNWDTQQKVGDAFMEAFSKLEVLEVYTSFVNNCNRAKNAIRSTKHQRPSFAKFLESTAREHKGKLTLDNLLIKPVQKFPNYEMLFTRLIKHTDHDHPDQKHLQDVLKLVHDILVHINCKEREILENGQREATLRELEGVIEGITDLIAPDRQFLLFDLVSMPSGQGARKERGFFLFNDLLVLTSIKKRSGTIRKPNTTTCPGTVASTLDTNKYKFLTKISLDCLDIVKTKDENLKRIMAEIENLAEDCNKLQQITEITASLKYPHQYLEDVIRELHRDVQRQLSERQTNDAQLNMLELTVSSPNGSQKLSIVFSKAEKRSQWEETFNEAKQKLAATLERHPIPEFLTSIPIRKTRAGLQFTCAAATLSEKRDVWVCNSDGYVGQVCIMSLHPEPNVTSCNGVCNARILCVASVPAYSGRDSGYQHSYHHQQQHHQHQYQSSDTQHQRDYRKSSSPNCQSPVTVMGSQNERRKTNASSASLLSAAADNTNSNNSNSDIQLDLNLSSSDEEAESGLGVAGNSSLSSERVPSPAPSIHTTASTSTASTTLIGTHQQQDSNPEESEGNQSTMWIGTEDGCVHVYNSTDNIRIKKNRIKIEHHSAVYSILYLDNRVFVSLANGDICVYLRDGVGWNTNSSHCISIGTVSSPISKLLNVHGKLWCSIQGIIKVLDIETLLVVNQLQISSDSKPITNMTVCNNYVWISIQNSAHIKCFHSISHQLITEVNLAPAVNKMLSNCDEIIRQHKAACLRVTSLLSCKDLIWIGTSAGVLLTIPAQGYEKGVQNIVPTGIPHGHTGHVRFLTFVETAGAQMTCNTTTSSTTSSSAKDSDSTNNELKGSSKHTKTKSETNNILIISGGDGYEDFRNSGANSLSEIAGREDSTNHLLIWQI